MFWKASLMVMLTQLSECKSESRDFKSYLKLIQNALCWCLVQGKQSFCTPYRRTEWLGMATYTSSPSILGGGGEWITRSGVRD